MDPNLRNGYAQDFFLGVQQSIGDNLTLEVNGTGIAGPPADHHRYRESPVHDYHRATAGRTKRCPTSRGGPSRETPTTTALSALVEVSLAHAACPGGIYMEPRDRRSERSADRRFFQSRLHDGHQCELDGAAVRLSRSSSTATGTAEIPISISGRICFCWASGGPTARRLLTRGWQVSWMAAFRTGFPYIDLSLRRQAPIFGDGAIENQRADLINPAAAVLSNPPRGAGRSVFAQSGGVRGAGERGRGGQYRAQRVLAGRAFTTWIFRWRAHSACRDCARARG